MADPPDVTVHGVLAVAMPAGTPRQQSRNCGLKQRVSLDLKRGVLLVNRPPNIFSRIRAFSGQPMDLDPAAGNGLLAALGRCGKQPLV
jgi:hypothetical protein